MNALTENEKLDAILICIDGTKSSNEIFATRYMIGQLLTLLPEVASQDIFLILTNVTNEEEVRFDMTEIQEEIGWKSDIAKRQCFHIQNPMTWLMKAQKDIDSGILVDDEPS